MTGRTWRRRSVELTGEAREALQRIVARSPKAYLRERASAILKVAAGAVASQVAERGLLTAHKPDTVYAWLDRYEAEGVAGLEIRSGRGRKPTLFPPHGGRGRGSAAGRVAGAARE